MSAARSAKPTRAFRARIAHNIVKHAMILLCTAAPKVVGAQQFDRTKPPALGAPAPLIVPTVHSAWLVNGMQVSVVEQHELPLVQVIVTFDGGARLDGPRPGLASFTAAMLTEGAGLRDANALQSEIAYLGATLTSAAAWDAINVSLKVPLRSLGPALDLLADVIQRPTFTEAEVRRQRDLRLTSILRRRDQPEAVADLAFHSVVFPAGHPYHAPRGGDTTSTASTDSAALRNFYRTVVRPEHARVVVVGDVSDANVRQLLSSRFATWRPSAAVSRRVAANPTAPHHETRTHLYLVDNRDAAQSVIIIGWPGVDRLTPDYPALTVMNTLLGGSFSSRLNTNLREVHGFSYGASSDFDFNRLPGPFAAAASVRTDATDSSLVEFFREFRRLRDTTPPDDEVARAKSYVELGLPGSLESTSQIAGNVAELANFGLPLSEMSRFAAKLRLVTTADVHRVARTYLTPDRASVIIVGDLSKIRTSIEALKLGDITIIPVQRIAQ